MIGMSSFWVLSLALWLLLHIEHIISLCYSKFVYLSLQQKERSLLKKYGELSLNNNTYFWVIFFNIWIYILKGSYLINIPNFFILAVLISINFITVICYFSFYYFKNYINFKYLVLILQTSILIIFSLFLSTNFLILFFILETLSVCYYFLFLYTIPQVNVNFINPFKNILLSYLWNSFLTSICFTIFLVLNLWLYGTLSYKHLYNLWSVDNWVIPFVLILSIGIKLGLPTLHILKLQIYTILDFKNLFLYAILTIYLNLIVLLNILMLPIVTLSIHYFNIFWFLLALSFTVISYFNQNWNVLNLLMYSSVATFFVFIIILLV